VHSRSPAILANFGLLLREQEFLTADISDIFFCWSANGFGSIRVVGGFQILRDFGKLQSTFFGSTNMQQRIYRTLFVKGDKIWHGKWSGQSTLTARIW